MQGSPEHGNKFGGSAEAERQGCGRGYYKSEHTKYAPMHIELHAKTMLRTSVAIESFGTPLISPFNLKTIFSNYDFESNRKASHELSISFVY